MLGDGIYDTFSLHPASSTHLLHPLSPRYPLLAFTMITPLSLGVLAGALLPAVFAAPTNTVARRDGDVIPGKYIVTLKSDAAVAEFESHLNWVSDVHRRSLSKRDTIGIENTYNISDWHAYAGEFDEETLAEIKSNPDVRILRPLASFEDCPLTNSRLPLSKRIPSSGSGTPSPSSWTPAPSSRRLAPPGVLAASRAAPRAPRHTDTTTLPAPAHTPTSSTVA